MADNRPTVANLDFSTLKQDMINYFKGKPEFADYEFTGSSLNLLMDILAYNTHYNSLAANFLVNEMFLDSALIRNNIVSIAKLLNYTPRSAKASTTTVTITVTKQNDEKIVIIPGGSLFTAAVGNYSATFYTIQDYVVQFLSSEPNGTTKTIDVEIFEGTFITERKIVAKYQDNNNFFELKNLNADIGTLVVSVNGVKYDRVVPASEDLFNINKDSTIYFIEESRTGKQKVIFGNGILGKALEVGDEVVLGYLATSGANGNGISSFTANIPGRPNAYISSVSNPSQGGDDRESNEEIKDYAPKWYQSQYRAVTENDYEAIIRNKFADIQSIRVYGGEEIGKPGKVFIAIKPKSADALSSSAKYVLKQEIIKSSNIITVEPIIVDPEIIYLILNSIVIYDKNYLTSNTNILKTKVFSILDIMNNSYIGDFNKPYRESNLSYEIRNLDGAIKSSNTRTELKVVNLVSSITNLMNKSEFNFNNRMYHPQDGFNSILRSSLFTRVGSIVKSGFDDDGFGNIRLYDLIDGKKTYINKAAGMINYVDGTIKFTSDITIEDSTISIYVVPDSNDIESSENVILQVASEECVIDIIEQNDKSIIKNLNLSRSI